MKFSILSRAALIVLTLLAAACSTSPDKDYIPPDNSLSQTSNAINEARLARLKEDALYRAAHKALENSDFSTAIKRYDDVTTRYPFSEYATQSELERVYAYYRSFQPEQALVSADHFLRDHPRHPAVAYVQYIKGLVDSDRSEGLGGFLYLDTTKEDVGYSRSAFDDFAVLVQKYPNSPYVGDARQRMIYLRNRIASHEMHIVRFYMKRRAYIAAAKRAEDIVTQYPGSPVELDALRTLEIATTKVGLTDQAADAHRLLEAQLTEPSITNDYPPLQREPGFFGRLLGHKAQITDATPPPAITPAPTPTTVEAPKAQDSAPTTPAPVAAPTAVHS